MAAVIDEAKLAKVDAATLKTGAHDSWSRGACVMEAVAYVAGEKYSDHPECASPVLGAFLRSWNDVLPTDERQRLKRYIPRLVGSRGTPEQEDARAWLAMDWLVRTYTPVWLRFAASTAPQYAVGLAVHAARLAGLPEFRKGLDVPSFRPTIDAARTDAAAAGDAARAAAGAAAWAAAWDAAWAAARAAAGDAARAAAGDAAWAALRPAVVELQAGAHELVERMLAVTE